MNKAACTSSLLLGFLEDKINKSIIKYEYKNDDYFEYKRELKIGFSIQISNFQFESAFLKNNYATLLPFFVNQRQSCLRNDFDEQISYIAD